MNRNSFVGGPVPIPVIVLFGVVAAALSAAQPAFGASSGQCVTARVDAPFRLPDGQLYPAGTLTLCDGGEYSPVDTFQRISVEGSSVGLFVSNRRPAESRGVGAPRVLFNRDADGNLELIGYTLPSSGRNLAFRMKTQEETWRASYRRSMDGSLGAPIAAILATTGTH